MSVPATINNGDIPDATKLMAWFNYLLAGKGIQSGTMAALDAAAGTDPFLAIVTDPLMPNSGRLMLYTGNRAAGSDGFVELAGW